MRRGRKPRRSVLDDLFDLFIEAPWWSPLISAIGVGLVVGVGWNVAFSSARGGASTPSALAATANSARLIGLMAGGLVRVVGAAAQLGKLSRRSRFRRTTSIESVRGMPWRSFELLVAEAYRRRGYSVRERGGSTPDDGVDVEARRAGETLFIQCKRYRERGAVGVDAVRSLLGAVAHAGATRGVMVCSGRFTPAAVELARDPRLELVDGRSLIEWLGGRDAVASAASWANAPVEPPGLLPPACPRCGEEMVRRYARRGPNRGSAFWGCRRYPACRGTRPAG